MTDEGVPVPPRLAARPRDARGYPIPVTVLVDANGLPDFRVTDTRQWLRAVQFRTCGLCGEPLGRHLAFVGGPACHDNRIFTDLPMHRDCAEYALKVCPFLALRNFRYATKLPSLEGVAALNVNEMVSDARPACFFLGVTRSYRPVRDGSGQLYVQAQAWEEVTWWQQGRPLAQRPDIARVGGES